MIGIYFRFSIIWFDILVCKWPVLDIFVIAPSQYQPRIKMSRALVMPKVSYSSSSWILKADDIKRLGAFNRHIWGQIVKFKWRDLISNERLNDLIGDRSCLNANTILKRQCEWLGDLVITESRFKRAVTIILEHNFCYVTRPLFSTEPILKIIIKL